MNTAMDTASKMPWTTVIPGPAPDEAEHDENESPPPRLRRENQAMGVKVRRVGVEPVVNDGHKAA